MPSKAGWKLGKMSPPSSSPTRATSEARAASVSARAVPRERVTSKPYSAAMRSTAREAVTGTTMRPGGHLALLVHEEHLLAASVEEHAQVGAEGPHDVRELLERPLEFLRGLRDARLVEVGVEGDHLDPERAQDRGEDRRGGTEGVVEDHAEAAAPEDLAIHRSEEAVTVAIGAGVRKGERADGVHGGALEVLHEEEPLHRLLTVRRHFEPARVQELDVEDLRVVGRLPHMSAAGQPQSRDLIAHHGDGRHPEVLHVDAHREQA